MTASRDKTVRIWDVESGKLVSEPLLHKKEIESASLSADGRWLLTKSAGDWRIWDIAIDLDGPLPLWVPDLAEAVGAKQFDNQGALVEAKKSIVELRKGLLALKGDDFWSRFGRWFVMRGPERTISPNSKMTVRDYIERCMSGVQKDPSMKPKSSPPEMLSCLEELLLRDRPSSRAWPYLCDSDSRPRSMYGLLQCQR